MVTVKERAHAVRRAQDALKALEQHKATTVPQLGAARDQLNIANNSNDRRAVLDAAYAIESLVLKVTGRPGN